MSKLIDRSETLLDPDYGSDPCHTPLHPEWRDRLEQASPVFSEEWPVEETTDLELLITVEGDE